MKNGVQLTNFVMGSDLINLPDRRKQAAVEGYNARVQNYKKNNERSLCLHENKKIRR